MYYKFVSLLTFVLALFTSQPTMNGMQNDPRLRFIVISDLHVSPGSTSEQSLNNIISEVNESDFDFVVVTGDLTNSGSDDELLAVKRALDNLKLPLHILPGNHESNWAESAGTMFTQLWGEDRFLARHNGFMMVGFNTGPFMRMGDGIVKREDLYWLKDVLRGKDEDEQLIAFCHYPLADGLSNWFDVTAALKNAGCRAVFCGHGHSLRFYNFDGMPGIMCRSVILGSSPEPGYSIVELRNDSLLVYNKPVNSHPRRFIALNYVSPDTLSSIKISARPDYTINNNYSNSRVISYFSDSASIFTGPCIAGKLVAYGSSDGFVKAIDAKKGLVKWRLRIAGPVYSTPVFSTGVVMLGTIDGTITGINAATGKELWKVKTGRPVLAEGITDGKYLYIGGGDSVFYRLDCRTGKISWTFTGVGGLVQGRAALSESSVFFGAWDRFLYCLDRETGRLRWKWDNGKPQVLYSPGNIYPVAAGGKVFIVAPDRFMTAIDERTGKTIWRTGRHTVRESMGSSPDGSLIYAKLMNDSLIAVSTAGDIPVTAWKVNASFGYEHNPCPVTAANDEIILATRDGIIISIESGSMAVKWKYKAGNSSVQRIAVDKNNNIWCTLAEGKIVAIKSLYNHNK